MVEHSLNVQSPFHEGPARILFSSRALKTELEKVKATHSNKGTFEL